MKTHNLGLMPSFSMRSRFSWILVNVSLPDVGYSTLPSNDVILSHLALTSSGVKSRLKKAPSLR